MKEDSPNAEIQPFTAMENKEYTVTSSKGGL
jgi:hypothetical protein